MLPINHIHHIAIICSNYEVSKKFYTEIMGFEILQEVYREQRDSYKLDLKVNGLYQIELFSFPNPPARPSRPEAVGLRHIAFETDDVKLVHQLITQKGVECEPVRIDETTGKEFFFFTDPDGLPIEFYEK